MSPRYFLALIAAAVLLLWNLNYATVWNPDEGRYISASLEMIAPLDGSPPDWVVPHLNTIPRLNKPPLVYWSAAALFKVLGINVTAARLASALAAIAVSLLLFLLGQRMFNKQAGVLAAVTWATCVLPFTMGRMLSTDMQLAFSITLALTGLYLALIVEAPRQIRPASTSRLWFIVAAIGLGLALLSKGPVGVALPLLIAFTWMLSVAGRRTFRVPIVIGVLTSLTIAVLLALPWYVAINRVEPQFLMRFLWGENVGRLTGAKFYHNPKPFWFYIPVVMIAALPWTAFLWPALRRLFDDFKARRTADAQASQARLFLWIWAVAVIGLFSLSSTKLITYILPALPPLALLIAQTFFAPREDKAHALAMRRATTVTALSLLFLGIAISLLFLHPKLLADKIMARADTTPFALGMSAILIVGAFALLRYRQAARILPLTGGALFIILTSFMGRFALYEDPSPMIERLLPYMESDSEILQFKTFQPSVMYYTRRPSVIVDFANRSGLDEEEYETSGDFVPNHDAIAKALTKHKQIFVLTRWKHVHWPTLPKMYTIAINNDYRLLSNRPAPAGYHYEFIAPRKRHRELSPACKALAPDC